jgi:putative Mg2+ transporter-C (MgtC) family protein
MDDQLERLALVGLAALLGGLVGLEREITRKPAGLRTHMLVAAATCTFVVLSEPLSDHYVARYGPQSRVDILIVLQAIMAGIGFLGAGTIVSGPRGVEGLTTAASILIAAGIGVATGAQQLVFATGLAVGAVLVLVVLGRIERRVLPPPPRSGE